MAIAAPARRSAPQTVPEPSRTEPPEPKKRPRDRPRPGGQGRSSVTASTAAPAPPKRRSATPKRRQAAPGGKAAPAAPGRKKGSGRGKGPTTKGPASKAASPIRKVSARSAAGRVAASARATAAPARKSPIRRKVAPKRRPAGVIPIAAGTAVRGAVAVTQLPESGLIHRLTRGRAWIGVLGLLLVGIVALNVVTLSFAASAGKVDQRNQELAKENSMLQNLASEKFGQGRIIAEAKKLGLSPSTQFNPGEITARHDDVATAATRLSAAAAGASAATSEVEAAAEGEATGAAGGGEAATGEEATSGEAAESEFTPEEEAIYNKEWEESVASEGGTYEAPVEETATEVPAG